MSNWLMLIPMELSMVEQLLDPPGEVKSSDHQVGEMDNELKKLYTLWQQLEKSTYQTMLDARYKQLTPEEEAKINEMQQKTSVLRATFWIVVKDTFQLWGKESIGVRHGFMVVWSDSQSGHSFFERFLRPG